MCDFISWIEYDGDVLFLTSDELKTARGKELLATPGMADDIMGHGAIRAYYNPKNPDKEWGKEKECTDFSNPKNFPAKIVKAIKAGKFAGVGICESLLTAAASAEYQRVTAAASAEYQRVRAAASAEYQRVTAAASAEYQRVTAAAYAEYQRVTAESFWKIAKQKKNRRKEWK